MEAKYTPGPWRWEVALNSKRVQLCGGPPKSDFGKYDLTVMSFDRYGMSGAAPVFWRWDGHSGEPKRADALAVVVDGREHHANWFRGIDHPDAHLIAAAPDLLEACKGMIEAYWTGSEDSDDEHAPSMVKAALVAIAKAQPNSSNREES